MRREKEKQLVHWVAFGPPASPTPQLWKSTIILLALVQQVCQYWRKCTFWCVLFVLVTLVKKPFPVRSSLYQVELQPSPREAIFTRPRSLASLLVQSAPEHSIWHGMKRFKTWAYLKQYIFFKPEIRILRNERNRFYSYFY